MRVPLGAEATVVFAPSSVRLHAAEDATPAPNSWTGTVATLEPLPGGMRLRTAEHPAIAIDCPSTTALANRSPASVSASRFIPTMFPYVFRHAVTRFRIERGGFGATVDDP